MCVCFFLFSDVFIVFGKVAAMSGRDGPVGIVDCYRWMDLIGAPTLVPDKSALVDFFPQARERR